jgi:hypothetical protein
MAAQTVVHPTRKNKALATATPLNFLLTGSAATLDSFELAKLAAIKAGRVQIPLRTRP